MLQRKEYPLQPSSVDLAAEEITDFLTKAGIQNNAVVRNRLFAEEILLHWLDNGITASFAIITGFRRKKPVLILEVAGLPENVLDRRDEEYSLLNNLLNSLGSYPAYSYKNGKNIFQFSFPGDGKSKLAQIVIAIGLAVLTGLGFSFLFAPETAQTVLTDVIDPLYATAFRILGFISGPLILLSVIWGIYGIGDISTLNLVGKRMIIRFLLLIFTITMIACIAFQTVFRFDIRSATGSLSSFKTIFEMILDIIPPNIIEPFTSGNTLHIIFCAVIIGIAMLYLGKTVSTVADLVQQIYCIVQFLMAFISSLMPFFVYLIVVRLILNGTLSVFSSVWRLFIIFLTSVLLMSAVFTATVCVRHRVPVLNVLKKSLPTFLIAITTASSAAAFSSSMETCEKKFGVDGNLCAFGIPLGMVMFKTGTAVYYVLLGFFFAKQFGVAVSPAWLVSAAFVSALLSVATPPISGGGIAAYTMLFARLGIPDDALAIVFTMDVLFDFIRTAVNMYVLPLVLIGISASMKKLDKETLRKT